MKRKITWFLIDDDYDDQIVFEIAIKEMHQNSYCLTANNGLRALQMLNEDPTFIPDYILMDLNMPVMNGWECLKQIKLIDRIQHIPVYIYSSPADNRTVAKAIANGASGYISKQATIPAIIQKLEQIIFISQNS